MWVGLREIGDDATSFRTISYEMAAEYTCQFFFRKSIFPERRTKMRFNFCKNYGGRNFGKISNFVRKANYKNRAK